MYIACLPVNAYARLPASSHVSWLARARGEGCKSELGIRHNQKCTSKGV